MSAPPAIYSMTGYAVAARELPSGTLTVEIRAVNNRYLDIQFRLPEELRALEPALRELLAARLSRGEATGITGETSAKERELVMSEEGQSRARSSGRHPPLLTLERNRCRW